MTALRKVKVTAREYQPASKSWGLVDKGCGLFHGFGVSYEEFEEGPGNYSTAIVEMPNGTIVNAAVEFVTFLEPLEWGKS